MSNALLDFLTRLGLALRAFGRMLGDAGFAETVARLERGESASPALAEPPRPAPLKETLPDSALQLLALLQQEGRFIDFLEENVTAYSDAEIGGAARQLRQEIGQGIAEQDTDQRGNEADLESGTEGPAIGRLGQHAPIVFEAQRSVIVEEG